MSYMLITRIFILNERGNNVNLETRSGDPGGLATMRMLQCGDQGADIPSYRVSERGVQCLPGLPEEMEA